MFPFFNDSTFAKDSFRYAISIRFVYETADFCSVRLAMTGTTTFALYDFFYLSK